LRAGSLHEFDGGLVGYGHIEIGARIKLVEIFNFLAELEGALLAVRILKRAGKSSSFERQTLDETAEQKETDLRILSAESMAHGGCATCHSPFKMEDAAKLSTPGYCTLKGENDYQIRCMDAAPGV
jgi:hypothetical protein